jgi:hypothetical protein
MAALPGFQAYAKGMSNLNLAPVKKPNPVVKKYQQNTEKAFAQLPDQINAQSQAEKAAQEAEALGQTQQNMTGGSNAVGPEQTNASPQQHMGSTQEGITAPVARSNLEESSGPDPIAQIGKAATNAQNMSLMSRLKAAQAGAGAGSTTGGSTDFGSGDIPGLDADQAHNARAIAAEGRRRGMTDADINTAIMTSLAESGLRNLNYGDRDSVGLFQQRTSQGWGSVQQIMDPTYSAGKFYESLARVGNRASMNPWQAAQAVQRSAFSDGSNYRAQYERAQAITRSIVSAPTMNYNGSAQWINQHNNWYGDYDGQYAMQCVDLFNFYTSGFVGGNPMMGSVVGASDIWNNHDSNAYVRVGRNSAPQMGDVVVFDRGMGGGYGHVGIVAQRNPDGTVRVLNANATSRGPYGNTVMTNFSTTNILGYLRPRKLMGL